MPHLYARQCGPSIPGSIIQALRRKAILTRALNLEVITLREMSQTQEDNTAPFHFTHSWRQEVDKRLLGAAAGGWGVTHQGAQRLS